MRLGADASLCLACAVGKESRRLAAFEDDAARAQEPPLRGVSR